MATSLPLAEPSVAAVPGVTILGERLPTASWYELAVLALGLVFLTRPVGADSRGRESPGTFPSRRYGVDYPERERPVVDAVPPLPPSSPAASRNR